MPDPAGFEDTNLVETLCDECEERLKAGEEVDLLALANRCENRLWGRLVPEILLLDIDYARRAGTRPTRAAYRERYPGFLQYIEAVAATLSLEDSVGEQAGEVNVSLCPGRVLAHFELVRELGSGASGVVWEAIDLGTTRRVAVKVPRWNELSVDERLRFFREGRAASRLDHENLTKLFEVSTAEGRPYLVSELVEGETLRERLLLGPMSPETAASICLQLARALHHAHQRGVLHRDVKPANILIRQDDRPCLTDFGLAKCRGDGSELTEHGDILGTPAYMAPEQARGRTLDAGPTIDVYGLGVVLFEALTGRTPFLGDSVTMVRAVADEDLEAPSPSRFRKDLPPDLVAICRMAIQKRPADRYGDAEELASDLERYLRGETVQARRPPAAVRCLRYAIRRKRVIATVAVAMMATLSAMTLISRALLPDSRRPVEIETIPVGTRVAFVPVDQGNLLVEEAVFGEGEGLVRAKLNPGDYLVVAVTQDERFHEVYRRVPVVDEEPAIAAEYQRVRSISEGVIRLKSVEIPSKDVTDSMVLVDGGKGFTIGYADSPGIQGQGSNVPAFYMDPTEFRLADHRHLYKERDRDRARFGRDEPEAGWACSYYEAVDAAEAAGKRLPTEAEYEFAATAGGTSRYPWGDVFPDLVPAQSFGTVASVPFDRFEARGVIYGLCSNLAEWTIPHGTYDPGRPAGYGAARGGNSATLQGDPKVDASSRDPLYREYVPKDVIMPGLGLRAVRSATPLYSYDAIR